MTNISNETKAKVIAQYIGQEFVDKYEAYQKYKYVLIGVCKSEYQVDSENVWLALSNGNEFTVEGIQFTSIRPLSELSNEEAVEVAKIFGFESPEPFELSNDRIILFCPQTNASISIWFDGEIMITDGERDISIGGDGVPLYLLAYQYLQSIGIDLPQFLLGGKTLKEAGLALYQNDLK